MGVVDLEGGSVLGWGYNFFSLGALKSHNPTLEKKENSRG